MKELRQKIDKVDNEIIILLQKRFEIIKNIAEYKKVNSMNALQPGRWQEVLNERKKLALSLNLDENMVTEIWNIIHKYAILEEEKILK